MTALLCCQIYSPKRGNANNNYFASIFFFQTIHEGNAASGPWITNDECGKTIVWGTMDAGINNVICMELHSGPKMANCTCGKTIIAGTIDRGSTVFLPGVTVTHTRRRYYLWSLLWAPQICLWKCSMFTITIFCVICDWRLWTKTGYPEVLCFFNISHV